MGYILAKSKDYFYPKKTEIPKEYILQCVYKL